VPEYQVSDSIPHAPASSRVAYTMVQPPPYDDWSQNTETWYAPSKKNSYEIQNIIVGNHQTRYLSNDPKISSLDRCISLKIKNKGKNKVRKEIS
jgi:hypothetical protein